MRRAIGYHCAILQADGPVAYLTDSIHIVRDQHDDAGLVNQFLHTLLRLDLKGRIPRAQDLIQEQDLPAGIGRDGECQPDQHTGRIGFDREIDKITQLGELDDLRFLLADAPGRFSEQQSPVGDVLPAGRLEFEAKAQVKQGTDLSAGVDLPALERVGTGDSL